MDDESFKIYVDQLREGSVRKLAESFDPSFLEVDEEDLKFHKPVSLHGEAYIAGDELVLYIDIATVATIPCKVCNAPVETPIEIKGHYEIVPQEEYKSGIYTMRDMLREVIILECPELVECHQGCCPQRQSLAHYFKKEEHKPQQGTPSAEPSPFEDLNPSDYPEE